MFANPAHDRSNNRMQYLFLNGRYIRDRSLAHALSEAYRGLLMTGRYAISFLNIDIPADQVDVNVHPTKMEVRFVDGGRIYSQLLGTIRSRFLSTDLTANARLTISQQRAATENETLAAVDSWSLEQRRMSLDFGTRAASNVPPFAPFPDGHGTATFNPSPRSETAAAMPVETTDRPHAPTLTHSAEGTPAMQVYNRYLITESDEGVVVIDQHALHERILYEDLREKVLQSDLEVQKLLVPEPVQLTSAECEAVLQQQETLGKLGIEVERIGTTTLIISRLSSDVVEFGPSRGTSAGRRKSDGSFGKSRPTGPLRRTVAHDLMQSSYQSGRPTDWGGDLNASATQASLSRCSSLSPWSADDAGFLARRTRPTVQTHLNQVW